MSKRTILIILAYFSIDKTLTIFSFVSIGVVQLLNFIVSERTIRISAMVARALNMRIVNLSRISSTVTLIMIKATASKLMYIGRLLTIRT